MKAVALLFKLTEISLALCFVMMGSFNPMIALYSAARSPPLEIDRRAAS
jgi:hypothetical protein